jgi:hypothetical protein
MGAADDGQPTVSPSFLEPLKRVLARGVPVLFVFGSADTDYWDFRKALELTPVGGLLKTNPLAETVEIEGDVHGLGRVHVQDEVIKTIAEWVTRHAAGQPRSSNAPQGPEMKG